MRTVHGGDKTGHWSVGDVLMRISSSAASTRANAAILLTALAPIS
jgi:hypothetical protein